MRIAVIAVHGVGSPPEFETARSVAELLQQHGSTHAANGYPASRYDGFEERFVTIPTAPVRTPDEEPPDLTQVGFAARATTLRPGARDRTPLDLSDRMTQMDLDIAFMRKQIVPYERTSKCPPYRTIELQGKRLTEGPNPETRDIHVYEMHWADLSRVGKGAFQLIGALYQLMFHVAHLGRKAVDLAADASRMSPESDDVAGYWKAVADAHAVVVRLFTVGVPVASLLLLCSGALFIPDAVAPSARLMLGTLLLAITFLFALGACLYFRSRRKNAASTIVVAMLIVAAVATSLNAFADYIGGTALGTLLLGIGACIIVVAAYVLAINAYDRSAPEALAWGLVALVLALFAAFAWGLHFVSSAPSSDTRQTLRLIALAVLEWSGVVLSLVWVCIWIAAFVTTLRAFRLRWALRRARRLRKERRTRGLRALWTARVTLGGSLFAYIVIALVAYQCLTVIAWRVHQTFNVFPTTPGSFPLIFPVMASPRFECQAPSAGGDPAECARRFFDDAIAQQATIGLPVALITAAISLLLVSWFIVLITISALREPRTPGRFAVNTGQWMSNGFVWMRRAGSFLVVGLGLAISLGLSGAAWMAVRRTMPPVPVLGLDQASALLNTLAIAVLASSVTIAAARARLDRIAARARPALGIVLDVDNYLRESPPDGTPRAMIAERYSSLLHHILERRDVGGHPFFDRVVIVSHSQGTVITADLLRYLTIARVAEPNLEGVDTRLLTMGSPLRQLYAANFPHLYDWIDRTDDFGDTDSAGIPIPREDEDHAFALRELGVPHLLNAGGPLTGLSPSPAWLRLRQWTNLYTSGDYVGRTLWQSEEVPGIWEYQSAAEAVTGVGRRERCLGDGTHTRYWTSRDVAHELDAMIAG